MNGIYITCGTHTQHHHHHRRRQQHQQQQQQRTHTQRQRRTYIYIYFSKGGIKRQEQCNDAPRSHINFSNEFSFLVSSRLGELDKTRSNTLRKHYLDAKIRASHLVAKQTFSSNENVSALYACSCILICECLCERWQKCCTATICMDAMVCTCVCVCGVCLCVLVFVCKDILL